jgi:hypothetical protein
MREIPETLEIRMVETALANLFRPHAATIADIDHAHSAVLHDTVGGRRSAAGSRGWRPRQEREKICGP